MAISVNIRLKFGDQVNWTTPAEGGGEVGHFATVIRDDGTNLTIVEGASTITSGYTPTTLARNTATLVFYGDIVTDTTQSI
jgi:hypothetical protein